MCINVACSADITVSQPLLNFLQAHPVGIKQASAAMAQVVETDAFHLVRCQKNRKMLREIIRVHTFSHRIYIDIVEIVRAIAFAADLPVKLLLLFIFLSICSQAALLFISPFLCCFIITKIDKVCVKFLFLTETLTLPRYDGGRKSERMMKNELREKGCGADRAADGRSRHAVLRRLAGRGGDSTEQSNQIMSGVCGYSASGCARLARFMHCSTRCPSSR